MTLLVVLLSVVIATIALPGAWLQMLRVRNEGTSEGLSGLSIVLGTSAASSWMTYGFMAHEPLQIVCNSSGVVAQVLTLGLLLRMAPQLRPACLALVAYVAVMVTVGVLFGAAPLGTLGAMLGFACRVPQVIKSWREPGGTAISVPNFVLAAISAFGWLAFGFIHNDMFVVASSATTILVSTFIVMRTVRAPQFEYEESEELTLAVA